MRTFLPVLLAVFLLCACSAEEPVLAEYVQGSWLEEEEQLPGGSSTLYFYEDKLATRSWNGRHYHQTIYTLNLSEWEKGPGQVLEARWIEDPSQQIHLFIPEGEEKIIIPAFYQQGASEKAVFVRPKR